MDILSFAEKYLKEFKIKGREINVKTCPFCGKSNWKFYVNLDSGKWKCFSGSCDKGGTILSLKHKLGIDVKFSESLKNDVQMKTVLSITPEQQKEFKPSTDEMLKWWKDKRGISKETLDYMKVCSRKGAIVFPYLQYGEMKMLKYRNMVIGKEKKVWQQEGGIPVLWGIDKIDYDEPVILSEGEPDMLSWIEAGYKNVVSVPFGTGNLDWIANNFEELIKIKELYLCFDEDEAGKKAVTNIKARLSHVLKLKKINLGTYNDVNDALVEEGKDKLIEFYEHAEEIKETGYYYAEDIDINIDVPECTGLIKSLDRNTGGFKFGEVVIWSAYTGCGKTTLLSQLTLNSISEGYPVCYYTGEDSKEDILTKIALQLYGQSGTKTIHNPITGLDEQYATEESRIKIKKDIGRNLVILEDEVILNNIEIKNKMQSSLTKDNCRIFIIDNLMQVDIAKGENENKNELQKKFIRDLVRFARSNNIQIHVVAHNKKPEGGATSGKTYDVSGASEIVNLAHMVIGIDKVSGKVRDELIDLGLGEVDATLNILKKRKRQGLGDKTYLKFDKYYETFYDNSLEHAPRLQIKNKKDDELDWFEMAESLPNKTIF